MSPGISLLGFLLSPQSTERGRLACRLCDVDDIALTVRVNRAKVTDSSIWERGLSPQSYLILESLQKTIVSAHCNSRDWEMIRPYIALCLAVAVSSFPQSGSNLCGSDENGVTRVAGDTWQEDCNRCKCTDNLLPGCTKRFCGVFPSQPPKSTGSSSSSQQRKTASLRENKCGSDERGVARVAGDTWQEDCNRCKCTEELLPGCTKRFCGVFPPPPSPSPTSSPTSKPTSSAPRVGGGGIMFPGDSRAEQTTLTTLSCTDSSGERREVGESWAEECNTCRSVSETVTVSQC